MVILLVLLFVAGAILKFVDPPFFEQAHQIGDILLIAGGVILVLGLIVSALGKRSFDRVDKEVEQRFRQFPRL